MLESSMLIGPGAVAVWAHHSDPHMDASYLGLAACTDPARPRGPHASRRPPCFKWVLVPPADFRLEKVEPEVDEHASPCELHEHDKSGQNEAWQAIPR